MMINFIFVVAVLFASIQLAQSYMLEAEATNKQISDDIDTSKLSDSQRLMVEAIKRRESGWRTAYATLIAALVLVMLTGIIDLVMYFRRNSTATAGQRVQYV